MSWQLEQLISEASLSPTYMHPSCTGYTTRHLLSQHAEFISMFSMFILRPLLHCVIPPCMPSPCILLWPGVQYLRLPVSFSSPTRAAAPTVEACRASRSDTASSGACPLDSPGARLNAAANIPSSGSAFTTGQSDPNANRTPACKVFHQLSNTWSNCVG